MKTHTNITYTEAIFDEYQPTLKKCHLTHILETEDNTRIMFVEYESLKDIRIMFDTRTKKQLFSEVCNNSLNIRNYYSINNIFFQECSVNMYEIIFADRKITMIGSKLCVSLIGKRLTDISSVIKSFIKVLYLRNKLLKLII